MPDQHLRNTVSNAESSQPSPKRAADVVGAPVRNRFAAGLFDVFVDLGAESVFLAAFAEEAFGTVALRRYRVPQR
jgi:hypothetical protein